MADIYIVDGSSIVYRSFHGVRDLKTSTGQPTNAVYGFITTLLKFLKEKKPRHLIFTFDLKGPTVRHESFSGYKANRKPMPDELAVQLPSIRKALKLFGIRIFEMQGYEADDIIASAVRILKSEDNRVYILTGDKDMFQLIGKNVFLINPADGRIIDRDSFVADYGVEPSRIVDIIGLAGDKSDNIPGIPGIGEKTAIKLIKDFGGIEEIFGSIERILPEKLRERLKAGRDAAILGHKLATLIDDMPLDISVEDTRVSEADSEGLLELFENLEFRKLARSIKDTYLQDSSAVLSESSIGFSTGEVYSYGEIKESPEKFKLLLGSGDILKCGFDLKSKMVELGKSGVSLKPPMFDLSIASHLTGKVTAGSDIFKSVEIYRECLEKLEITDLFEKVETPLIRTLAWLEMNGIKADEGFLRSFSSELRKEIDSLQEKIYSQAGEVFNINSSRQLSQVLFGKLGLPSGRKTKTGLSTDNSVLRELENGHPIVGLILRYREIYKLNSTYAEGLIPFISKETGRIHPVYSQVSTSTGRLSCSSPNLQNIPVRTELGSPVRKAFCAEGENMLYSFDYSQIELRILAHFSGDRNLTEAFMKGKDIHQETADILFPADSLFSPAPGVSSSGDARRVAKTINFGIIYGMGAFGLSQELGISLPEAELFIKEYFNRFSGVKEYMNSVIKSVEKTGYVSTILKRRRYIDEVRSGERKEKEFGRRAAINMPIQGSAADIIKLAMNRVYEHFMAGKLKSRMVLQVHDELLFETVREEEEEVVGSVREIMEGVMKLNVPLKVDVKKGPNYLDMEGL